MNETLNEDKRRKSAGLKIIYIPSGRAKEYADLALNGYTGCSFGCIYCFSPCVLQKDRKVFHSEAKVRDKLLEKVEKDCKSGLINKPVNLCFVCDAYQDLDLELQLTRKVLEIFKEYHVNFSILTKGGMRAARDFDLYKTGDSFGSTLTFTETDDSRKWEPNAAIPMNRIAALNYAHKQGIKTWVSMEPVLDPEQTLELISLTHEFVDLYKVGKLNSDNCRGSEHYEELKRIEKSINWKNFGERAESLLKGYGKQYYIKEDLRKEMIK
jgi:DNA repair photolyase